MEKELASVKAKLEEKESAPSASSEEIEELNGAGGD